LRLKDKHAVFLREQAREVNLVWNYCNELALKILQREARFCCAYDLHRYTAGATKEGLSLHSQTVQAIAEELVTRRRQFSKRRLAWRKSGGAAPLTWLDSSQGVSAALQGWAGLVWRPSIVVVGQLWPAPVRTGHRQL
jgi:putative transposase